MRNSIRVFSFALAAIILAVSSGIAYGASFEELVDAYINRYSAVENINSGAEGKVEDLWDRLFKEKDPEVRSEIGYGILNYLVDGDASKWNDIRGFIGPEGYPKSVVAFQAALVTVSSLLEMEDEVSSWKAHNIARDIFRSRKTINVVYRSYEEGLNEIRRDLRVLGGASWVDNKGGSIWRIDEEGNLPLRIAPAKKIRGTVRSFIALQKKMVFLNYSGQVKSGIGYYAWDLKSGKIYKVDDAERDCGYNVSDGVGITEGYSGAPGSSPGGSSPGGGSPGDGNDGGGSPGGNNGDGDNGSGDNGDGDNGDGDNGDNGDNGDGDNGDGDNGDGDGDNGSGDNGDGSGPGNGNGNAGNPGNGGGNNNGSGPGSGNNGNNNGQGGGSNNGNGGNGNGGGNSGGSGPGNGNGNAGNPGNGGGNNNGSGPGSGNNGSNNGQGGGSNNGNGGNGNGGNSGGGGSRSGLGDGTNPGGGSGNNNAGNSPGGNGTNNPGGN